MTDPIKTAYTVVENLAGLLETIQPEGIVSRTFYIKGFSPRESHAVLTAVAQGAAL